MKPRLQSSSKKMMPGRSTSKTTNKIYRLVVVCTASLLAAGFVAFSHGHTSISEPPPDQLMLLVSGDRLQDQLKPGDVVFRRGAGFWTEVFSQTSRTEGFFSHVGVIVSDPRGLRIRHAEADDVTGVGGVRSDTLETFLYQAKGVAIARPDAGLATSVSNEAASPKWEGVPFDTSFRLDDGARAVYCSEFVWEVMRRASGHDIVPDKTDIGGIPGVTVDDLLNSSYLHVLYEKRLGAGERLM
jgi:hypothetical protein